MNAKDYPATGEAGNTVTRFPAVRENRNLSSVVDTIRDDGPSEAGTDAATPGLASATPAQPTPSRVRALPDRAVLQRVATILLVILATSVAGLYATGRYPSADVSGLYLAEIPRDAEPQPDGVQPDAASWFADTQQPGDSPWIAPSVESGADRAAAGQWRQTVMARLDELTRTVASLQAGNAEQAVALAGARSGQAEALARMQALEAMLDTLQRVPAVEPEPAAASVPTPPDTARAENAVKAAAPAAERPGEWVVNVASSSSEQAIKALQGKLAAQGIRTEPATVQQAGKLLYRLRVTGFASRDDARQHAKTLEKEAGIVGAWPGREKP